MEETVKFACRCACVPFISLVVIVGNQSLLAQANDDIAARTQQLHAMFDDVWQYELRTNPELATGVGDNRYNDQLSDRSPEFELATVEEEKKYLAKFQAFKADGLSEQDHTSLELMIRGLK